MSDLEPPTPEEARAALASVEQMKKLGLESGLFGRWFAVVVSLWAGAVAVATAYDGPWATGGIALLSVVGFLGLHLRKRQVLSRVRQVRTPTDVVVALGVPLAMLGIGLGAAHTFELHGQSWLPVASGLVVSLLLFTALEASWRRARRQTERWS